MKKFRTHYDNLNVARNADIAVIKAAYKALAQKYHPDRNANNPNAERIMKIINTAYQVLIDPVRRAEHDKWIDEQEKKYQTQSSQSKENQSSQNFNQKSNNNNSSFYDYTGGQSHQSNQKDSTQNHHNNHTNTGGYYDYTDTKNAHNHHQGHYHPQDDDAINKPSFWSFGRMRRTTYILLSVPAIFILIILRIGIQGGLDLSSSLPSFEYLLLATMIELVPWSFLVFIGAKRLHDCNYKAWWIVMPFVVIAMWFWKPTQGANRFGDDPRDDYFDDEIEIEKDNSIWIGVAILLFYNLVLYPKIIDEQQKYENRQNNTPTYQDNQPSNTQTPNISSDDIVAPNINSEPSLNPQLVLVEAQKRYDNAVANINEVWNSLPPSTQEFLRAEQRAINKSREADCTAYGNAQSTDRDLAKAYRYLCEVPQLNERAEYLKTQINTMVAPSTQNINPAYQSNQNGYNLNYLINDTVKKSLLFLDRDSASYDGHSHKLESQDITHIDVNHDGIKDAVVALRYCEVSNCHMTTKSSELAVYLGMGNNQYLYGDIRTLGIDLIIRVDNDGTINAQSTYYSEHEDPACCPSMVVNNKFIFDNGKLKEIY